MTTLHSHFIRFTSEIWHINNIYHCIVDVDDDCSINDYHCRKYKNLPLGSSEG